MSLKPEQPKNNNNIRSSSSLWFFSCDGFYRVRYKRMEKRSILYFSFKNGAGAAS